MLGTMPASTPGPRERTDLVLVGSLLVIAALGVLASVQPFTGDQALFASGARQLAHGDVLYRDFWDVKQPGIYAFYLLGGELFGYGEIRLHLVELGVLLGCATVLGISLRDRFRHRWIAGVVPLLVVGTFYATVEPVQLGQVESLVGTPLYVTLWSGTRASRSRRPAPWLFGAGVAGGIALDVQARARADRARAVARRDPAGTRRRRNREATRSPGCARRPARRGVDPPRRGDPHRARGGLPRGARPARHGALDLLRRPAGRHGTRGPSRRSPRRGPGAHRGPLGAPARAGRSRRRRRHPARVGPLRVGARVVDRAGGPRVPRAALVDLPVRDVPRARRRVRRRRARDTPRCLVTDRPHPPRGARRRRCAAPGAARAPYRVQHARGDPPRIRDDHGRSASPPRRPRAALPRGRRVGPAPPPRRSDPARGLRARQPARPLPVRPAPERRRQRLVSRAVPARGVGPAHPRSSSGPDPTRWSSTGSAPASCANGPRGPCASSTRADRRVGGHGADTWYRRRDEDPAPSSIDGS